VRGIVLERFGGPEVLEVTELPEPECPRDGYVVEVEAIGLNFAEVVERRGKYRKHQPTPYPIGKECSGRVIRRGPDALAPEAGGHAEGDAVIVIRFDGGGYAERVSAKPDQILPAPPGLDWAQAASYAIAFGTAWYAQEELARLREGEAVLIQAAAGSVGTAAIQLAKARGATPVIGTAGGPAKCELVRSLGADLAIDYRAESFSEPVLEATGGAGVGYVLESVGGDVLDQSLHALAPMGRLVTIGFSSISENYAEAIKRVHPLSLFHRSTGFFGLNVENLNFPARRSVWEQLVAFTSRHGLVPHVGPTFALDEAHRAHAAIEARETVGKVVLRP
jgi:NADPH2:quinone reductase